MSDSDSNGQTGTLAEDAKVEKDSKRKKVKDDTEQPIYPCEDCTECFTTQADLKVSIFHYLFFTFLYAIKICKSFYVRCIQEHILR